MTLIGNPLFLLPRMRNGTAGICICAFAVCREKTREKYISGGKSGGGGGACGPRRQQLVLQSCIGDAVASVFMRIPAQLLTMSCCFGCYG